jgi:hypothetical protein
MMICAQTGRRRSIPAFVVLLLVVSSATAHAALTVTAGFGFDNELIPYRYAPVRVTLDGLDEPITGTIIVKQYVEIVPGEPTTLTHEIARGTLENGVYRATLPAYDSVLPVLVEVLDQTGQPVASASESVRQATRGLPFAVIAGAAYHFDDTEAVVGLSELPSDWWAYDPVQSVWIASPLTDRNTWRGLGEWVTAGGSLVLFSGSDFYQWDSPLARNLLPIADPSVVELEDGSLLLSGSPRVGAEVLLAKDVHPLLLRWRYGAGYVSLVTARLDELTEPELQRIAARVPTAKRLLTPDRLGEAILNQTPVLRPMYAFAPVLVLLVILGFAAFHRGFRRRAVLATAGFFVFIGLLTVGSGLYTNYLGRLAHQYSIITTLRVQTAFGIAIDSYAFFALDETIVEVAHEPGSFPSQASFQASRSSLYGLQSEVEVSMLPVPARARRFVRVDSPAEASTTVLVDRAGLGLQIENAGEPIETALLFNNGLYYEIPPFEQAAQLKIGDLQLVSASAMDERESRIYAAVSDWLSGCPGTWLLTYHEEDRLVEGEGLPTKVSVVVLEAVEGEEA